MLKSKTFIIDKYTFEYTPLKLTQARELYVDLMHYYGGIFEVFGNKFELPKNINLDTDIDTDVESFAGPVLKAIGSIIKEFTLSIDAQWLSETINEKILPNIKIAVNGVVVEQENLKSWYEEEFATKCSTELRMFLECLKIQYSDFLALSGNLSTTIKVMIKNLKK